MSDVLRPLLAAAAMLAACHDDGHAEDRNGAAARPVEVRTGDGRPLSPVTLQFLHVERPGPGGSPRTFIETLNGDRWTQTFGNLTFDVNDPFVAGLLSPRRQLWPTTISSSLGRLASPRDVVGAIKAYRDHLATPDLGPTGEGYVFLFPVKADYDAALGAVDAAAVPGLRHTAALTPRCAYARLIVDAGERQAGILFMHVPDGEVSLGDPGDRACVEEYFARNLVLTRAEVDALIFSRGQPGAGSCVLARILPPAGSSAAPSPSTGCPTAPIRRAATLMAFAQAEGVGLAPGQAQGIVAAIKGACARQATSRQSWRDETCPAILDGDR